MTEEAARTRRTIGDGLRDGFLQPLHALRLLAGDGELARAALLPATLLAAFCAAVALLTSLPLTGWMHRFTQVFVTLAPLPAVLLQPHYAHLAVLAHGRLGGGPAEPHDEPLGRALRHALGQLLLIAIGMLPLTLLLHLVPLTGALLAQALGAAWALYWVLVNALESARVMRPGETLADLDARHAAAPAPWFVRGFQRAATEVPALGGFFRWFARLCDNLSHPWREELALVEQHPALACGFALSTALLLCTPVLNLFFRPVVLVAAARVHRLLRATR